MVKHIVVIPTEKNRHLAVRVKRPGERRSLSRSATRALDVLEVFGKLRRPMRAMEIAGILDLAPSTANQLLKTMVESAHLLFDARTRTYKPSPRLAAMASWITQTYGVGPCISDLVQDVWTRTGFVATITTQCDLFMQVIDLAGPEEAGGERGLVISLFGSAIGSALLSTLEESEVRRLADRARVPEPEFPAIFDALTTIRETAFAAGPTTGSELWSIAVPMPTSKMLDRAVLGIAGPCDVLSTRSEHYSATLKDAAERWITAQ